MEVSAALNALQGLLDSALSFLSVNPLVQAVQFGLTILAVTLVFLVFWSTRDILQRTRSLFYQLICILIVAVLPIVGFFIYLLIRPARTLAERETHAALQEVVELLKEKGSGRARQRVHVVKTKLKAKVEKVSSFAKATEDKEKEAKVETVKEGVSPEVSADTALR